MAKIRVSVELLEQMIFGLSNNPIKITNVAMSQWDNVVVFEIEGEDVPQVDKVQAVVSERRNRAGDVFREMKFEEI